MEWYTFLIALILFIPAWFLELVIHEASHALIAKYVYGASITGFYPYPHKHEGKFYFARCTYEWTKPVFGSHIFVHNAPFMAGGIWAVLWLSVLFWLPVDKVIILSSFPLCGLGDVVFFIWTYYFGSPGSDGKKYRNA